MPNDIEYLVARSGPRKLARDEDIRAPMSRDEIHALFRLKGLTLERFAALNDFNYFELARIVRTGSIGRPGTKTWQMAKAVARELGQPFKKIWGLTEDNFRG